MNIGSVILNKRKALGYTQQVLADKLHVSFQAVSKWENGTAYPEVELLPVIAAILGISVDALLGYRSAVVTEYENRYQTEDYYWGVVPNRLCYEIMKLRPPIKPLKVLDMGCGEGKDAVFLARNGYIVSAFDVSDSGLEKGKRMAEKCGTYVDFFKANILDYRLSENFDIIFSSGVFHYIAPNIRTEITENLKQYTNKKGIHAINVFVEKPFIERAPDEEAAERYHWKSGELFTYYHDWLLWRTEEVIFDCNSGGKPHQHCMDIMIAEKK
ncbi:MAG: methyltransferase domain-containing protein [Lachnospiraceae bacterium]|nr:methyltransferase domain-containing protein [Lachnospiraceae bacterium]